MGIEIRDDDLYSSAMPAGSWLIGGIDRRDTAPTSFAREAILNYISASLATVASSGSASDLTSGTIPNGRLHAWLADISEIQAPSAGDVIQFDGTSFVSASISDALASSLGLLSADNNLSDLTDAAAARANLELGSMALEDTGDYLTTTAIAAAYQPLDGDLSSIAGLSTTTYGRSLLTLASSTALAAEVDGFFLTPAEGNAAYQPLDSDLTTLAGLAKTDGGFIVGDGSAWTVETGSTARASLGLGTMAVETAANYLTVAAAASGYQPLDADLTAIAALSTTSTGRSLLTSANAAAVAAAAGLGTSDTPQFAELNIGHASDTTLTRSSAGRVAVEGVNLALDSFLQAGTGAVARTLQAKGRDEINVNDFGATGDGTTDDRAAIQAAIDYCKTFAASGSMPTLKFGSNATRTYKVTGPLDFTQVRATGWIVDFGNSVIIGATSGAPIIDALDTQFTSFRNGIFYGPSGGTAPSYGIQQGRAKTGQDAAYMSHYNLHFTGGYTKACFLNAGCEIFRSEKCNYWNDSSASTAACVIEDSKNATHVSSTFFTATIATDTQQSHNDNIYINCSFEQIGGAGDAGGPAVYIMAQSRAHHFLNCYAQNQDTRVLELGPGEHTHLVWDVHCEPDDVTQNIRCRTDLGNVKLQNCTIKEYYMFATDALIHAKAGSYLVEMINCDIEVPDAYSTTGKVFSKGSGASITYHGRLRLGVDGDTYDLSALTSIQGDLDIENIKSTLTLPTLKNVVVRSNDSFATEYWGIQRFKDVFCLNNGTNIASASTITIPTNGSAFYVTGTTNINAINVDSNHAGRFIVLTFGGVLTLNNSLAGGTLLASSFTTAANSRIALYFDGTYWTEICRTNLVPA